MKQRIDWTVIRGSIAGHEPERILPPGARRAAVLIPLLERDGEIEVLFEERSAAVRQGGEICFPGGRAEPRGKQCTSGGDLTSVSAIHATRESGQLEPPRETAIRETAEELLLPREQIELLAPLCSVTGPGGTEVDSFLGILHGYHGTYAQAEVARTFSIPLSWFQAHPPAIHDVQLRQEPAEDFPWHLLPGGRAYPLRPVPRRVYFYQTEYGVIWGMTAELLHHFLKLLPAGI